MTTELAPFILAPLTLTPGELFRTNRVKRRSHLCQG